MVATGNTRTHSESEKMVQKGEMLKKENMRYALMQYAFIGVLLLILTFCANRVQITADVVANWESIKYYGPPLLCAALHTYTIVSKHHIRLFTLAYSVAYLLDGFGLLDKAKYDFLAFTMTLNAVQLSIMFIFYNYVASFAAQHIRKLIFIGLVLLYFSCQYHDRLRSLLHHSTAAPVQLDTMG